MSAYSLSPVPCNDIRLRSGKIVEPVIIEDALPSVHKEGVSPQHPPNTIPIIENAEHPLDGMAETSNDKSDNTQSTQLIRQPPYPERLMLPRIGGATSVYPPRRVKKFICQNPPSSSPSGRAYLC